MIAFSDMLDAETGLTVLVVVVVVVLVGSESRQLYIKIFILVSDVCG